MKLQENEMLVRLVETGQVRVAKLYLHFTDEEKSTITSPTSMWNSIWLKPINGNVEWTRIGSSMCRPTNTYELQCEDLNKLYVKVKELAHEVKDVNCTGFSCSECPLHENIKNNETICNMMVTIADYFRVKEMSTDVKA